MLSNAKQIVPLSSLIISAVAVVAASSGAVAQTTPIKPADVMGDKSRSGPDGWVEAPVTRDRSPSASPSQKAAGEPRQTDSKVVPASTKPMSAGDDPGTPVASPSGPGRANAAPVTAGTTR